MKDTKEIDASATNVKKPVSMLRDELAQKLVDDVNNSGLPLVLTEYIVRDLYEQVRATAMKQYEKDKEDYQAALDNNK